MRQDNVRRGPRDRGRADGLLLRDHRPLQRENRQGADVSEKYRTGVYSEDPSCLREAETYIWARSDRDRIRVEVLPLTRYIPSAEEHQDHLDKFPGGYCHIPPGHS
ncbi:peptide-methionine (S)-S-oxide reductase [Adlercreutzia wanghongyangiae]|uniref:peptide-methionine (S)-S-oxide reductase n=1 Tax=Adlercreutzia wanghongyangiae TaxID=3111451 RepID=UPI003741EC13